MHIMHRVIHRLFGFLVIYPQKKRDKMDFFHRRQNLSTFFIHNLWISQVYNGPFMHNTIS
jgi:hypothetical protein